jgi:hypothetical protein
MSDHAQRLSSPPLPFPASWDLSGDIQSREQDTTLEGAGTTLIGRISRCLSTSSPCLSLPIGPITPPIGRGLRSQGGEGHRRTLGGRRSQGSQGCERAGGGERESGEWGVHDAALEG